jgi:hypothetical protein
MRARFVRAFHEIERYRVVIVREAVKLEPEHVGRHVRDPFDRGIRGCRQNVGHATPLRLARKENLRARPHHARRAHRRDAERGGVASPEQLYVGRDRVSIDAVAGQEFDVRERPRIAPRAFFVVGAPIDKIEGKARHPPLGPLP